MNDGTILITAPALDAKNNVSGVSSVVNFIISDNTACKYRHFELGRKDGENGKATLLLRLLKTYCKWAGIVWFGKIKLVHFNFALSKASILRDAPLVIFAKIFRKKIIIHLHGGDYLFSKTAPGWMQFLLNRVFAGNTPVVVLSEAEVNVVKEKYGAKNIYVLPNCVNLAEAEQYKRVYNKNAALSLLFIGRISNTKGLDFIYNALAGLKKQNLQFKFLMAGAGPQESEYVQKFAALLGNAFEFKGVVSGNTKTALYQNSDVFLLPSLFEGLPMSLIEAMSFGLVPVVTNVGSVGTVVVNMHNGIMTALNDNTTAQVEAGIKLLSENSTLVQKMSEEARDTIFKNFDPAEYINKLNKIYAAV